MSLPDPIITVLSEFQPAFTRPTWKKVEVLLTGAILARGRRTVTAALRPMGLHEDGDFSLYHQVLNRAVWSPLEVSRRLLCLLVETFVGRGGTVEMVVDETLERRWGRKIVKRGHWRDSLLSSTGRSVSNSGLRWLCLMLVIRVPWSRRRWALPFLSILTTSPQRDAELGQRHKTLAQWTMQAVGLVRRWLPEVPIKLVGDGAYSVIDLGLRCVQHDTTLIAPLRLDAGLYAAPPPPPAGKRGRPRVVGPRLPTLTAILADPQTEWHKNELVPWYGERQVALDWCSGTALWYHTGHPPLSIRWVLTRDLAGKREPRAFFSTNPNQDPLSIVLDFVKRWTGEVTLEESRAHLGVETQRQWSDLAIERTTPCLLGLFSLVTLLAHALHPEGQVPVQQTAWYRKSQATFADVLTTVRRHLWGLGDFQTSPAHPELLVIPRPIWSRLVQAVSDSF